jgi:hypothetical protein
MGTDRQRGRALWRYLKSNGDVEAFIRVRGALHPARSLSSILSEPTRESPVLRVGDRSREVNASMWTAMHLAANMKFVAAGAVYCAVMQRISAAYRPEFLKKWAKQRRQEGAKFVREKRSVKVLARRSELQK